MNLLKSLKSNRRDDPGINNFKEQLEHIMCNPLSAPLDRNALTALTDLIINHQLTAIEALRVLKEHIKQGCEYEPPHRVKALQILDYMSTQTSVAVAVMEQLSTSKWRQRLKQVAVESYSPPLQDQVVQMVYRWASQYRSHDWGLGMQQLLFELEEEGIIVQGAWKLDGAKPVVIALLGSPRSPTAGFPPPFADSPTTTQAPPHAGRTGRSDHGAASSRSPPAAEDPYKQDTLLAKAESMAGDAVALVCAAESLEQATTGSGTPSIDIIQKGKDLTARCTLHLSHLQAALSHASLSDTAMAQLCDIADALNNAQACWDTACQQHRVQSTSPGAASNPAKPDQASASGPVSPPPPPPLVDLLSFEDDEPLNVKRTPGDTGAPEASPAAADPLAGLDVPAPPPPPAYTPPAPAMPTPGIISTITGSSSTTATGASIAAGLTGASSGPTGGSAVAAHGPGVESGVSVPDIAVRTFFGQGLQLAVTHGGSFPDQTMASAPGQLNAGSLPLSPSNPFAMPGGATPGMPAQGQPTMASAPTPIQGHVGGYAGMGGVAVPGAQEVEGLRAALASAQVQLDSQATRHAAAMTALRQQHQQELTSVTQQAGASIATLQQRIGQLEAQLAQQQQQQQPAGYGQVGGALPTVPVPVPSGGNSGAGDKGWVAF